MPANEKNVIGTCVDFQEKDHRRSTIYVCLLKSAIILNPDRDLKFQFSHHSNMAPYQIFCLSLASKKFMMHIGSIEYHNIFFQSFLLPLYKLIMLIEIILMNSIIERGKEDRVINILY